MEDSLFAEQRLSGANPMIIRKLEPNDPRAEPLKSLELKCEVNEELRKGNIYICDYTGTDPTYRGPCFVAVCTPCSLHRPSRCLLTAVGNINELIIFPISEQTFCNPWKGFAMLLCMPPKTLKLCCVEP
jgi:hypothetical protein